MCVCQERVMVSCAVCVYLCMYAHCVCVCVCVCDSTIRTHKTACTNSCMLTVLMQVYTCTCTCVQCLSLLCLGCFQDRTPYHSGRTARWSQLCLWLPPVCVETDRWAKTTVERRSKVQDNKPDSLSFKVVHTASVYGMTVHVLSMLYMAAWTVVYTMGYKGFLGKFGALQYITLCSS